MNRRDLMKVATASLVSNPFSEPRRVFYVNVTGVSAEEFIKKLKFALQNRNTKC